MWPVSSDRCRHLRRLPSRSSTEEMTSRGARRRKRKETTCLKSSGGCPLTVRGVPHAARPSACLLIASTPDVPFCIAAREAAPVVMALRSVSPRRRSTPNRGALTSLATPSPCGLRRTLCAPGKSIRRPCCSREFPAPRHLHGWGTPRSKAARQLVASCIRSVYACRYERPHGPPRAPRSRTEPRL